LLHDGGIFWRGAIAAAGLGAGYLAEAYLMSIILICQGIWANIYWPLFIYLCFDPCNSLSRKNVN